MFDLRASIAQKLHPDRVQTSPKFTALLAYLLGEEWTDPQIHELSVTVDGLLNVWTTNGDNAIEGTVEDLKANIRGVAEVAGLTREELYWLLAQIPAPGRSGPQRGEISPVH